MEFRSRRHQFRDAGPFAAAAKGSRWSTAMSDSSDDQKSHEAAQATSAAAERQEQEKAEAARLSAKQERLLQKQREDNARKKQSLGGGSSSSSLDMDPQHFPLPQAGATGSSPRVSGSKGASKSKSPRGVESAPTQ